MTSQEAKVAILKYCLCDRSMPAAVTEGLNHADVLAIEKQRSIEFEVKVNRSDLVSELADIAVAVKIGNGEHPNTARTRRNHPKLSKHRCYLYPETYRYLYMWAQRPNFFYFVVPEDLVDVAKAGVQGTPYGVYELVGGSIYCRRRGKKLHDQSVTSAIYEGILRRSSLEAYYLRAKLGGHPLPDGLVA